MPSRMDMMGDTEPPGGQQIGSVNMYKLNMNANNAVDTAALSDLNSLSKYGTTHHAVSKPML